MSIHANAGASKARLKALRLGPIAGPDAVFPWSAGKRCSVNQTGRIE
jgi:hypothetical protein